MVSLTEMLTRLVRSGSERAGICPVSVRATKAQISAWEQEAGERIDGPLTHLCNALLIEDDSATSPEMIWLANTGTEIDWLYPLVDEIFSQLDPPDGCEVRERIARLIAKFIKTSDPER